MASPPTNREFGPNQERYVIELARVHLTARALADVDKLAEATAAIGRRCFVA
jgi:hypothetical protein